MVLIRSHPVISPEVPMASQQHSARVENRGNTVPSRSPRTCRTSAANPPTQAPAASTCTIIDDDAMS